MKKSVFIIVSIALLLFSCGELIEEDYIETITVRDIPGTIKLELPIKWDIGKPGGPWRGTFSTEIRSFNPFASLEGTAYGTLYTILDGLFDYDMDIREWSGIIIKDFQVNIDKENDHMEMICELREDIYWSDGIQMTADDVVFYFSELDGDQDISPRGYNGQMVDMPDGTEKQIQIEKIDTFRFKYIFPRIMANPCLMVNSIILPKHIWEPAKQEGVDAVMKLWDISTPPEDLIGNAAYFLEEYRAAERMVFIKNINYWMKDEEGNMLPYVEKNIHSYVPQGNVTMSLLRFQQGEIDSYTVRGIDMPTLLPEAEEKGFDIWNGGPTFGYRAFIINQNPAKLEEYKLKIFKDKRFHNAVSCLIDRETIINEVMNGFAEPYYHFVAENNKYYNPQFQTPYEYNPESAKEILSEMGLKDINNDGFLEDEQGNTVSIKVMSYSKDQDIIDLNNMIIEELKGAGINASMDTIDYNVWAERLQYTYDWESTLLGFSCPTFPEQWTNVWPSWGDRHYWYPGQEEPSTEWEAQIDELYKKLPYTYNEEEIRELYNEFQRVMMENLPIIPVSRSYSFFAIYKKWGNINWDNRHDMGGLNGARIYLKGQTALTQ